MSVSDKKSKDEKIIFRSHQEYLDENDPDYKSKKGRVDRAKLSQEILSTSRKLINEASTLVFGSSLEQVATVSFEFLAECEYNNRGANVINSLVFSFMLSQTTSTNLHTYYRELNKPHLFEKFEITSRDDRKVDRVLWERGSKMNGTAIRLIGHLVLECAYRNKDDVARQIIKEKGSIFREPTVTNESESKYTTLCKENYIGDDKEELVQAWCEIFKHPVLIVMSAFSGAVADWKPISEKTKDISRRNI